MRTKIIIIVAASLLAIGIGVHLSGTCPLTGKPCGVAAKK